MRVNPNHYFANHLIGVLLSKQGKFEESINHFYRALRLKSDSIETLKSLAWILATTEDETLRNPGEAVKFARLGCELTDYKNPELLDALAAAYAAAGRFTEAVTTVHKALRISRSTQQKNLFQEHLSLFKVNKTYIESPN